MCESMVQCPRCDRLLDDSYEIRCVMVAGSYERAYRCPCGARVTVQATVAPETATTA